MEGGSRHSREKHARALWWARILLFIPFSRSYFLAGSVAKGEAREESDIDIVAVARRNYVWLHRALLFLFLSVVGMRRTHDKRRGRICVAGSFADPVNTADRLPFFALEIARGAPLQILETVLIASGLAYVAERVARWSIQKYVRAKLAPVMQHDDTVLDVTSQRIVYFPPRTRGSYTRRTQEGRLDSLAPVGTVRG